MSFIVRHKRLGKKLSDVFADRRLSGLQLARETIHDMDNISIAVANEWVHGLNTLSIYDKPVEYNDDGSVKLPDFPVQQSHPRKGLTFSGAGGDPKQKLRHYEQMKKITGS